MSQPHDLVLLTHHYQPSASLRAWQELAATLCARDESRLGPGSRVFRQLMSANLSPSAGEDFDVAIVCALVREFDAVEASLDESYDDIECGKARGDPNIYTFGRTHNFNVVIVLLAGMGKAEAASGSAFFKSSFPHIKLCLAVGICAGYAHDNIIDSILLGDPLISSEVVQADFGRQTGDKLIRKDTISNNPGRPSRELRAFLQKLQTLKTKERLQTRTIQYLGEVLKSPTNGSGFAMWIYPGADNDRFFRAEYAHRHRGGDCDTCNNYDSLPCDQVQNLSCDVTKCDWTDPANLVKRDTQRPTLDAGFSQPSDNTLTVPQPHIHIGAFSSADHVLRSASHRDALNRDYKVIGYEMEGAGIWDNFENVVIIKSACDYADSHKNKLFQNYAAATAAACAKAFLDECAAARVLVESQGQATQRSQGPANADGANAPAGASPAPSMNFSGAIFNSGGGTQVNGGSWNNSTINFR